MPRRVLLMISSMRGGGSEQQTLLLLKHLDRSLFTPLLYLTERCGDLMGQLPQDVVVHAYRDVARPTRVYFPGRVIRDQTQSLADLLRREAVDVIYDRTFHMTMIAGQAGQIQGIPRVSTIVSPPESAIPMVENRFVWLKRRRLARAYRRAHRVVAVSREAADSAERYYRLPGGSIDVIRNPVDRERINELASHDLPHRDQRLTLVCVGRMTQEKGHKNLIEAIQRTQTVWPSDLPPIHLWMIGDGPLRTELENQWNSSNKLHEVVFLGTQINPAPFIKSADALVLPSLFEGMPNVVLEAMALETPVIATKVGGTKELQRDRPSVLWVQPGQSECLADAIIEFATHREAAKQRVEAALRLVREHHNVATCVARIQTHLLEACERPHVD